MSDKKKFLVLAAVYLDLPGEHPQEFFRLNDIVEADTLEDAKALCERHLDELPKWIPDPKEANRRLFIVPMVEIRRR